MKVLRARDFIFTGVIAGAAIGASISACGTDPGDSSTTSSSDAAQKATPQAGELPPEPWPEDLALPPQQIAGYNLRCVWDSLGEDQRTSVVCAAMRPAGAPPDEGSDGTFEWSLISAEGGETKAFPATHPAELQLHARPSAFIGAQLRVVHRDHGGEEAVMLSLEAALPGLRTGQKLRTCIAKQGAPDDCFGAAHIPIRRAPKHGHTGKGKKSRAP